jgi:para-aminobenzoate synthetase component 1
MHTRQLPLDLAPWALFRALARKERSFFIDAGQPWGDEWFSSMGFGPRMQFRVTAAGARTGSALAALDETLATIAARDADARPRPVPFAGGVVLALAYETKDEIERLAPARGESADAPRLVAAVYDAAIVYDHRRGTFTAASWHLDAAGVDRYAEEVLDAAADVARSTPSGPDAAQASATDADDAPLPPGASAIVVNPSRDAYHARAARIREYITAGDVYQVNLSLRLQTAIAAPPLATYGRLRAAQPVPFGAYFDLGGAHVLSNSPELFLRRRGDRIETCPVKGTRPRGGTPAADARLVRELRTDAKETAEHVMIVDLERNDLGRVCRTGSVRVERFADLATFHTVHHLVSSVCGTLPSQVTVGDLLRATFPGGSITGAPKIRAMEIIDEVEDSPRGFYTGALGWIDASGDLDLNVAIRTAVAADGTLTYRVGSGIVADSDPEREHAECLLKADAFVRALEPPADSTAGDDTSTVRRRAS